MTETGLYLGKFAPLHKGHQYCIETALDEVDELIILIYDEPDVTDIPLVTRAEWLRDLYPRETVLEAWTGPTELSYDDHTAAKHEKYVVDKLESRGILNIDKYYSSEPYGEHMSNGLDAEDRRIDMERAKHPISATALRASMDEGRYSMVRKWVDERVYRDLVTNVVILGGPSTGKTTLARELAAEFTTEWQPEVGREFWKEHADENGLLSKRELLELAMRHVEAEEQTIAKAGEYLFTDTNPITTGLFSKWYHGDVHEYLKELMLKSITHYDVVILCDDDIPFEEEEGRGGPKGRKRLQRMHESWLNAHGVPYHRVSGSVEERVAQVSDILERFNKWDSGYGTPRKR